VQTEELKLLGALDERTKQLLDTAKQQRTDIGNIFAKLDTFPCVSHDENINVLLEWKTNCNGDDRNLKLETAKGAISLKNAIVGGVIIALISQLPAIIMLIQNAK